MGPGVVGGWGMAGGMGVWRQVRLRRAMVEERGGDGGVGVGVEAGGGDRGCGRNGPAGRDRRPAGDGGAAREGRRERLVEAGRD